MALNIVIIVGISIFYVFIFVAGLWVARVTRNRKSASEADTLIVGAKDIGLFVGLWTVSATWCGGVAINGTAEAVYDPYQGLIWAISVPASAFCLIFNGLFFVEKLRKERYLTSLDPYEAKYGKYSTIIFFLIEATASIFYAAAILNALGGTVEVVAGIPRVPAVIISVGVSVAYTVVGGLYSVAYTDIIQLFMIFFGLVLALPFVLTNEAVANIVETASGEPSWIGVVPSELVGSYVDLWLSLALGQIPLQPIYQRVFAVDTTRNAQILCVLGGILSVILAIPSAVIGAAAASTNWTMTSYQNGSGISPLDLGNQRLILPIVLQYMTPTVVTFFGIGAVSAGVMSSLDSAFLAEGTLFGRNIHKKIIRPKASPREVAVVMRIVIVIIASLSTVISLSSNSIVAIFYLCADFTYVLTLPQFVSVMFMDPNIYGAIPALIVGFILRMGGGDYLLGWAAPFSYIGHHNFPTKTVAMLTSFLVLNLVSHLAKILFGKGYISERFDILQSNLASGGRSIHLESPRPSPAKSSCEKKIKL